MTQLERAQRLGALLQQLAQLDPEADAGERRAKPKCVEENGLILIDLGSTGRFIVKTAAGTVHRLKSYGSPLRNAAYATLDAAIADHESKLKTLKAGGAVEITPTLNGWRIEKAKTGRGTCRVCGRAIAEGELRFGQDVKTATWFHLGCAAQGAPRAFRPFAEKAAALQKSAPAATSAAKTRAPPPAMLATLRQRPDDVGAQKVFADWLQSNGDPWGELISLEHAGQQKEAKAFFRAHAAQLSGGFGPRLLTWRNGFIESARLEAKSADAMIEQVKALAAVPQAVVLRELGVEVTPNAALFTAVSQYAPPTVQKLSAVAGPGLSALAMPRLERLWLRIKSAPRGLEELFSAQLPKLEALSFMGKRGGQTELGRADVLPLAFLEALLTSKLLSKLRALALDFGSLDEAGVELLFTHRKALSKIPDVSVCIGGRNGEKLATALRTNFAAHSRAFDRESERLEGSRVYS